MAKLWIAPIAFAAAGAVVLSVWRELKRYLMIRRADRDPSVVGISVTPQGNMLALNRSAEQRRRDRERVARPAHFDTAK